MWEKKAISLQSEDAALRVNPDDPKADFKTTKSSNILLSCIPTLTRKWIPDSTSSATQEDSALKTHMITEKEKRHPQTRLRWYLWEI